MQHADYIIRVRPHADGYTATVRQLAPGLPADVAIDPRSPVVTGQAATAPAAMLAAIVNARIPELAPVRRTAA